MKKLNKKGFSVIEATVVFLVLVGIVGVGFYVWQASHNKDKQATVSPPDVATTKEEQDEKPAAKEPYLEVEQLGVKLSLANLTYKDLTYTTSLAEGTTYTEAYLSSESLKAAIEAEEKTSADTKKRKDYGAVILVMIPTSDFKDGFADYPMDGGSLSETYCEAAFGDKKLCVISAFVDYGNTYAEFIKSVRAAAKDASEI